MVFEGIKKSYVSGTYNRSKPSVTAVINGKEPMSHSAQIDLAVTSGDPHYFGFFPRNMLKSVTKKYRTRNFRYFKKILRSVSPKETRKTKNYSFRPYRFGYNLDSKFYVRKQIFYIMGESRCGVGLELMRKSKLIFFLIFRFLI